MIVNDKTLTLKSGRKASVKFRKWLKLYIENGNATESARIAYKISPKRYNSAQTIGFENVRKLNYDELMEMMGISDSELLSKLKEGLQAQKTIIKGNEEKTVSDMPTQHKYLETALKLKRRLTDAPQVNVDNRTLILDATTPLQGTTEAQDASVVSDKER